MTEPRDTSGEVPADGDSLLKEAMALHDLSDFEAAETRYLNILAHDPRHPKATHCLGLLRRSQGNLPSALDLLKRSVMLSPRSPLAHLHLGLTLWDLDRPEEAYRHFDVTLRLKPDHPQALFNCALALQVLLRPDEALELWDHLLTLDPGSSDAWMNRGITLLDLQRPGDALESYARAEALKPKWPELLLNRGTALFDLKRFEEALATYALAESLKPDWPELRMSQAMALHAIGRHREALAAYDRILAFDPGYARAHSGKISLLDFIPGIEVPELQGARKAFYEEVAKPVAGFQALPPRDLAPDRRLILGFSSPNFKQTPTASCFLPIFQRHSKADFQINCYSDAEIEDDWTQACKDCSDVWWQTRRWSHEALAEQIRKDGVDILVDLMGHSDGNRLLVFARRPAPIQVSAWGQGGGTGLPMMDCLFADPVSIPPEVRHHFAETIYDLPCHLTFEAPAFAPPVAELPAHRLGTLTFGCLNRYTKVTPEVEELWAQILNAVPDSRLLLKDGCFEEPEARHRVAEVFAHSGIHPKRLVFRGLSNRTDHLATYGEVDIALDPFPQNGGITTMEALWMGAPVLSLLGRTLASRASGAILRALDLGEWVASSPSEYLDIAIHQASRLASLSAFRREIRARILASPAGNPGLYTLAVERAYRSLWHRWIATQTPEASLDGR